MEQARLIDYRYFLNCFTLDFVLNLMSTNTFPSNPLIERLPKHLKQFIKPQDYDSYTAIDQSVWRYVMKKNVAYLSKHAHSSYLNGLKQTGITLDKIPSMYGMNRILKDIGWAAVAVDGFIPPNAFMEFQAYKVLVIASDIRKLENIEYTPSPDIIHEASGHAPIIANQDYAEYLRRLGAIGAKAILSKYDIDLYEAVRKLSILKEAIGVSALDIQKAEEEVSDLQAMDEPFSEMAKIRNLQWWTVEYGLISTMENSKIYGAGLLSSIGESMSCMKPEVNKLSYSLAAAEQGFDITKKQPQLYVTPDFAHLMAVLEEFANTLSLRKGGKQGLEKLIESQRVGTIELSTGLQVSGKFTEHLTDERGKVIFFKTAGPSALAYRDKELIGHGIDSYPNGFCSVLGDLKRTNLSIENMGPFDLKAYNFYDGELLSFEFKSGIKIAGRNITGIRAISGKLLLIRLVNCTVSLGEKILFHPDQGVFDMAIGTVILSAFAGAADPDSFPNLYEASETNTIKTDYTASFRERINAYEKVNDDQVIKDQRYFEELTSLHPEEWLLFIDFAQKVSSVEVKKQVLNYLNVLKTKRPAIAHLIADGIEMI